MIHKEPPTIEEVVELKIKATLLTLWLVVTPPPLLASGGGHSGEHSSSTHASSTSGHSSTSSHSGSASHPSTQYSTPAPSHTHSSPPSGGAAKTSHPSANSTNHHGPARAQDVARNSHGKIARSEKAKNDFKRSHPCPSTGKKSGACPGYVVDHIKPLKRGGQDSPSNMQWQTLAAAKAKDRTE
jgi:hypothetical protein